MYKLILLFTVTLTSLAPTVISASARTVSEYDWKAEFIYNFSKFTRWPDKADEIMICIYGKDPFGSKIDVLNNRISHGRKIKVIRTHSIERVKSCQIAFVNSIPENQRYYNRAMRRLNNSSVLTMANDYNAHNFGVMIGLITNNEKVSFNINSAILDKSEIEISSKLLRLAKEFK